MLKKLSEKEIDNKNNFVSDVSETTQMQQADNATDTDNNHVAWSAMNCTSYYTFITKTHNILEISSHFMENSWVTETSLQCDYCSSD